MSRPLEVLFTRCDKAGRGWLELEEFKQICQEMGISTVSLELSAVEWS